MPGAAQLPRTRRRRGLATFGSVLALVGAVVSTTTVARGGSAMWVVVVIGVALVLIGALMTRLATRRIDAAYRADLQSLHASGGLDELPMGARWQGQAIGLRTKSWVVWFLAAFSFLTSIVGLLLAVVATDPDERIASACFLGAGLLCAVLLPMAAGTAYWIDVEGVSRTRFPMRHVGWSELTDVTVDGMNVRLRSQQRVGSTLRPHVLVIPGGTLEIAPPHLAGLIRSFQRQIVGSAR